MTTRTAAAVVVKVTMFTTADEERTLYYGPFLPHAGGATKSFISSLEQDLEESGRYQDWEISIESVFIGEGESDCEIRATR